MSAEPSLDPWFAAGLTAALSFALTGAATVYSRRVGLLDHPGERHSHRDPTPRGGGAGLVAALLAATLGFAAADMPAWWAWGAAPGVTGLALMGWWDDHRSLPVLPRFLVQVAVSLWLLGCFLALGLLTHAAVLAVSVLAVIWMTNLYNFMDGSNGMAGLQGMFVAAVLAGLFARAGDAGTSLLAVLLGAACLGFLPWNLGRAKVFMGDVGSLVLGYALAALLLAGLAGGAFSLPVGLLVVSLFAVDATATLLARVSRGERWYTAHRQHAYQRLIAHGWSHGRVATLYQAVNLAVVMPGIGVAVLFPEWAWPAALSVLALLFVGWYVVTRKTGVLAQAG